MRFSLFWVVSLVPLAFGQPSKSLPVVSPTRRSNESWRTYPVAESTEAHH